MKKFNAVKSKETYRIFKVIFKHFLTEKKPLTLGELLKKSQSKTSISGLSEKVNSLAEAGLIDKKKSGKFILIEPKVKLFELYNIEELLKIMDDKKVQTIVGMVFNCSSIAVSPELAKAIHKEPI